ncbi:tyrosine-type recombinase/integrase [Aestuariicoccus sp. MJ-SS9]|uniref:tyrosine-type recombinase/integrase n=1 Tax=Aestuariicoccus sp. MJ-SS9 TaxID=3079855 RepID=UPI00290BE667|nr:tyrosine-type recombinase/integrase [Aestuariicoccus sp. MJ-SS9]MDU8914131.1 tyrosine-type recombinase/integrase [Aestuariicoccus sp. MJ-SS9]
MKRGWPNLPFEAWPEQDRAAWQELLRDGDVLEGRGPGAHWSEATRHTLQKHYAGWLGWLDARGMLDQQVAPSDRITPEAVTAYAHELMACVAPKTVESYVRDLKVVAKVLSPDRDLRWLMDVSNRLKHWAKPSRTLTLPALSAAEMFRRCFYELDRLADSDFSVGKHRIAYRDTLLVALLISAPVRLRNLEMIRINQHLELCGHAWHLRFTASETKTHQTLHLVLHEDLGQHIAHYIYHVRPAFPKASETDRLWPASKGRPMAHQSINDRVRRQSEHLFGEALSPHAFRTIAATFLAETSPEDALQARPLLGHRSPVTTEKFYIKANQLKASQRIAAALKSIRDEIKAGKGTLDARADD